MFSFWTASAASTNSCRFVGPFSGSRPACWNRSLLYIHTDRSMMNGRPYFLPSHVDASICAAPTFSMPGRLSMRSVRSANRPADVQFGMNTTSAENRSGSSLAVAALPTTLTYSSVGTRRSSTWFWWVALYSSTCDCTRVSVAARLHIVMVEPSSTPCSGTAPAGAPDSAGAADSPDGASDGGGAADSPPAGLDVVVVPEPHAPRMRIAATTM